MLIILHLARELTGENLIIFRLQTLQVVCTDRMRNSIAAIVARARITAKFAGLNRPLPIFLVKRRDNFKHVRIAVRFAG